MKFRTLIIFAAAMSTACCCVLPACTSHEAKYNDMVSEDHPVEVLPQSGVIESKTKYEYSGDSKPEYIVVVKFDSKEDVETFGVTKAYYNSVRKGDKFEYDEVDIVQKY